MSDLAERIEAAREAASALGSAAYQRDSEFCVGSEEMEAASVENQAALAAIRWVCDRLEAIGRLLGAEDGEAPLDRTVAFLGDLYSREHMPMAYAADIDQFCGEVLGVDVTT